METQLTILTVVENDISFLDLMIESIVKFTHPAPRLLICDNSNGQMRAEIIGIVNKHKIDFDVVNNAPKLLGC